MDLKQKKAAKISGFSELLIGLGYCLITLIVLVTLEIVTLTK